MHFCCIKSHAKKIFWLRRSWCFWNISSSFPPSNVILIFEFLLFAGDSQPFAHFLVCPLFLWNPWAWSSYWCVIQINMSGSFTHIQLCISLKYYNFSFHFGLPIIIQSIIFISLMIAPSYQCWNRMPKIGSSFDCA